MTNGRILHLGINEKFIDYAWQSFENVEPMRNDFLIFVDSEAPYIKKTPFVRVRARERLGWALRRRIESYDLVVVHSLHPFWIPVINGCSRRVVFVWLGWGFDYYDLIYPDPDHMLLAETRKLKARIQRQEPQRTGQLSLAMRARFFIERLLLDFDKAHAISRMRLFAPVLPEEYEMIRRSQSRVDSELLFPIRAEWNYGSLEEIWVKDFFGRSCCGSNILVGNGAGYSTNQVDALHWLSRHRPLVGDRVVYCTLSYGDSTYARAVASEGAELLPGSFEAIVDFMPLSEYTELIASCSHLFMNSVRQQGVGTVIIMLYLGATVILREECPTYMHLKSRGFCVLSMQQVEGDPTLLNRTLTLDEKSNNRDLLMREWSKTAIDSKTQTLISAARRMV